MTRSTTFKSDPWFKEEDLLNVVLFDARGVEIEAEFHEISILKSLESLSQRGQSYKVEAEFPIDASAMERKTHFLKVPDRVPPGHRDSLKAHFIKEMKRGEELNELISRVFESESAESAGNTESAQKPQSNEKQHNPLYPRHSFRLPRRVCAGMIRSRTRKGEEEEINLPFLVYEWIDGEPLEHTPVRESLGSEGADPASGPGKEDWFGFALKLAETVRRLHNHGFLHSYIVPRNILVQKGTNDFGLVGFGYSSLSIESSSKPHQVIPSDRAFRSPELDAGVALDAIWYASDIFSIGAVLFYVLIGNESEVYDDEGSFKYRDKVDELKADVRKALTAVSSTGTPGNDNVAKIIDNCLRYDPDDRFETVEDLIEAIKIAKNSVGEPQTSDVDSTIGSFFKALARQKEEENKSVQERITQRHHYEIYGSRTKIIEGLCRMVGALPKGSVYRTITLPSYWTQNNLGPDGRFLAMNKMVAKRGVRIERIIRSPTKNKRSSGHREMLLSLSKATWWSKSASLTTGTCWTSSGQANRSRLSVILAMTTKAPSTK